MPEAFRDALAANVAEADSPISAMSKLKNRVVKDLHGALGFSRVTEFPDGSRWTLRVEQYAPQATKIARKVAADD